MSVNSQIEENDKKASTTLARSSLYGVPIGYDALVLIEKARLYNMVVHVALDDSSAAQLRDVIQYFSDDIEVLTFPSWDCLPYDRVSPNSHIMGERASVLIRLAQLKGNKSETPVIVLTTLNAVTQRVPPVEYFKNAAFDIRPNNALDMIKFQEFLTKSGYNRVDTVRESGEFAIRGGLIDLYAASLANPVRIDLFGDDIETIRFFDPLTQKTTEPCPSLSLGAVSEIMMTEETIQCFRRQYREKFGTVQKLDLIYESVKEGQRHAGLEHWLPLFYEHMESIFDYLSKNVLITLENQVEIAREERWKQIVDFYNARRSMEQDKTRDKNISIYHPIEVSELYLSLEEWNDNLSAFQVLDLMPFTAVEGAEDAFGRVGRNFADIRAESKGDVIGAVKTYTAQAIKDKKRVVIISYSAGARERLKMMLADGGIKNTEITGSWGSIKGLPPRKIALSVLAIEHGFIGKDIVLITEQDILGDRLVRPTRRRKKNDILKDLNSLHEKDYVVHAEHGIGQFDCLEIVDVQGVKHDCLKLIYAGGDRLFLPVENLELLSRYGSEGSSAILDKLGGVAWQARRAKAKKDLMEMADELLKVAAMRVLQKTEKILIPEHEYERFVAGFPYLETEDQQRAIDDVVEDLAKGQAMDRLVCGDVGFGKTEVALRAAFIMGMAGYQVAVVAPTTLLVRQHYQEFISRFKDFPLRVVQLSRLITTTEAKNVKKEIEIGTANIVIGTHAVLNEKIKYSNLGMLIVDEEQRFGVKQKERLKKLKENIHVLTLTATPIPRTLQMSLTGVKELSLMATPPVDRLAIRTFVMPFDPIVLREALMREHYRGGQSFFVCPRISDLAQIEEAMHRLVPELKMVTAHGKMLPQELEDRIAAFYDGQYDILLATNIIEAGIDIPNVNTMIIHRAEMFGLAQLYQLRGRIGRSKIRGYAYLTYDPTRKLTKQAGRRMQVIEQLDSLGAGFQLASHDMDIRGAGNLLGDDQSGKIKEIGVELYQQMLEEAVAAAKDGGEGDVFEDKWTPQIDVGMSVLIPKRYVKDLTVRLGLYRRISDLLTMDDINSFAAEMIDRFGGMPDEVKNLLDIVDLKQLSKIAGVEKLDAGPKGAVVSFRNNKFSHVENLIDYIQKQLGTVKMRPHDEKLVFIRSWADSGERVQGARRILRDLIELKK